MPEQLAPPCARDVEVSQVAELASTIDPGRGREPCGARGWAVLNELTHGGGELSTPGDVRDIVASLGAHRLQPAAAVEQLARFLVVQHKTGS